MNSSTGWGRWFLRGAFALLLTCAVLIRVVPVEYGKPAPAAFLPDEVDAVSRAIKMGMGDLMPLHQNKPTLYNGLLAAAFGTDFAVRKILGGETLQAFERRFFLEPFAFYRLGRIASVLASLATIAALLFALRKLGLGALLCAAAVIGLAPSTVYFAHVAKEDSVAALFVCLAMLGSLRAVTPREGASRRSRGWLAAAGLAAGMAVSTKYNCFFAPLFPLIAAAQLGPGKAVRGLVVAALAILAGFVIGTPYAALHPVEFARGALGSAVAGQVTGKYLYVHNIGKDHMGFVPVMFWREFGPALVAVAAALVFALARMNRGTLAILLIPASIYGSALLLSRQLDWQYAILLTPLAAWLVAAAVGSPAQTPWGRAGRGLIFVAVAAGAAMNLHATTRSTFEFAGTDTRVAAAEWIQRQSFASDEPILIASPFYYRYYPHLPWSPDTFARLTTELPAGDDGGYFRNAGKWAEAQRGTHYTGHFLQFYTGFRVLAGGQREFRPQTFPTDPAEYMGKYSMVVVPESTERLLDPDLSGLGDVRELIEYLTLQPAIMVFKPEPWKTAGPRLAIYEAP